MARKGEANKGATSGLQKSSSSGCGVAQQGGADRSKAYRIEDNLSRCGLADRDVATWGRGI